MGGSTITDVYYMRTVDPDQTQPHNSEFRTENRVVSQRYDENLDTDESRAAASPWQNECFVSAEGQVRQCHTRAN